MCLWSSLWLFKTQGAHSLTTDSVCVWLFPALICAQLTRSRKTLCEYRSCRSVNNTPHWIKSHLSEAHKLTLTFISWLISLFTGCAGFLLRLFSGGLPFSISGIVLVLAGSDPDQCWFVSSCQRVFFLFSGVGQSESCHSRWQRLSFPDVWVPHLGLHTIRVHWTCVRSRLEAPPLNNRHSLFSDTGNRLQVTKTRLPLVTFRVNF